MKNLFCGFNCSFNCLIIFITLFTLIGSSSSRSTLIKMKNCPKSELSKVRLLLEESAIKAYPSDKETKYADLLEQSQVEGQNMISYYATNKDKPVFISKELQNLRVKVHVLTPDESYVRLKDNNTFVVLIQQLSQPSYYSVHLAYIMNLTNLETSKVHWTDVQIKQQRKLKHFVQFVMEMCHCRNEEQSLIGLRPYCHWVGPVLLCDSQENVKPIRETVLREPLDQVEPLNDDKSLKSIVMEMEKTNELDGPEGNVNVKDVKKFIFGKVKQVKPTNNVPKKVTPQDPNP